MSLTASLRSGVVVAESGIGYRQHRIPALTVTTAGTLIAAYDARLDLDDLPGPVDLVTRRSTDGGATWSHQTPIRSGSRIEGFGDASLLTDADTGAILCFHAASLRAGFFESTSGEAADDPDVLQVDIAISLDDGQTWVVRRLTGALRRSLNARLSGHRSVSGLFAASGSGTQVRIGKYAGRLLQGFVALVEGEVYAVVARSDDHGGTWTMGSPVGPGANECAVAALPDGRIALHIRRPGSRMAAWSEDGADTFGPLRPTPELLDPGNNGSLFMTRANDRLVCTHTRDPHLRRHLVAVRSADGGNEWSSRATLSDDGAGYSVGVALPDSGIGVLWEDEGYRRIVFTRLDEEDFCEVRGAHSEPLGPALVLDHVVTARPRQWVEDTETIRLPLDDRSWGPEVYKIVSGRHGIQHLRSRTSYAASLPAPTPGLHIGDVLTFSARIRLVSGDWDIRRGLTHVVSEEDLAVGRVTLTVDDDTGRPISRAIPVRPHPFGASSPTYPQH